MNIGKSGFRLILLVYKTAFVFFAVTFGFMLEVHLFTNKLNSWGPNKHFTLIVNAAYKLNNSIIYLHWSIIHTYFLDNTVYQNRWLWILCCYQTSAYGTCYSIFSISKRKKKKQFFDSELNESVSQPRSQEHCPPLTIPFVFLWIWTKQRKSDTSPIWQDERKTESSYRYVGGQLLRVEFFWCITLHPLYLWCKGIVFQIFKRIFKTLYNIKNVFWVYGNFKLTVAFSNRSSIFIGGK